jgi:hypothetical protein
VIESTQKVLVLDENRRTVAVDMVILRVIELRVDCGCYAKGHAVGRDFEVVITRSSAYIRAKGTDSAFRLIDMQGPITCEIEKVYNTL